jgi:hypothetical protein
VILEFNRKVRKGLRKGRKVFFCVCFSRKDAKAQSFVLCVGFGHGFGGCKGLTRIF